MTSHKRMLDDYIKGSDARVAQWSAARREAFSEAVAVIERIAHPPITRPGHFIDPLQADPTTESEP